MDLLFVMAALIDSWDRQYFFMKCFTATLTIFGDRKDLMKTC